MTADPNLDPTENSEDDFILEDAPVQELEDLFQLPPQVGPADLRAQTPQPADILFADTPEDETGAPLQDRPEFAEQGKSQWPGNSMTPSEMGLPVQATHEDPLAADDGIDTEQELEVIGDDLELPQPILDAEVVESDPAESQQTSAAPFGKVRSEYPVEDGWEPVAHVPGRIASDAHDAHEEHEQPADQTELVEQDAFAEASEGESASTEDELVETAMDAEPIAEPEATVEEELEPAGDAVLQAAPGRVIGGVQRRGRFTWIPLSAAAALLLGGGVVMMLRPDWLGLHFRMQLVDRVQVARPNVDLRTPTPPPVSTKATTVPAQIPVASSGATSGAQNTEVGDHSAGGEPATGAVAPNTTNPSSAPVADHQDAGQALPPAETQPVAHPTVAETAPFHAGAGLDKGKMLPVGESMFIGDFDTSGPSPDQAWSGVGLGSKAFAQLRNGNYFVGSVKAVAASALILRIGNGEITIPRADVEKITALDSEEYQVLQKATNGVLRLNNRNRLVGTILKSVVDDNYVLQMRSDRIVVPKHDVETMVEENADRLHFATSQEEDTWLKQVAERQMYPNAAASKAGKVAPDPSVPANPTQVPNKSSGSKVPVPQKASAKTPAAGKKS